MRGVPVTGPVRVNPDMVVAAKLVVPATLRFPVIASFPLTLELVIVVAPRVDAPVAFNVPGVVNEVNVVMLLVN